MCRIYGLPGDGQRMKNGMSVSGAASPLKLNHVCRRPHVIIPSEQLKMLYLPQNHVTSQESWLSPVPGMAAMLQMHLSISSKANNRKMLTLLYFVLLKQHL